jgi:hypothetical protein
VAAHRFVVRRRDQLALLGPNQSRVAMSTSGSPPTGSNTLLRVDHRPKSVKLRIEVGVCSVAWKGAIAMRGPSGIVGIIVTILVIYLILRFLGVV